LEAAGHRKQQVLEATDRRAAIAGLLVHLQ
jgi:hypothetical protein